MKHRSPTLNTLTQWGFVAVKSPIRLIPGLFLRIFVHFMPVWHGLHTLKVEEKIWYHSHLWEHHRTAQL